MVRSMYSGVSGLRTHQTRMDVIGNNIANVNTYGFKASRATFRDVFYQTTQGATAPIKGTGNIGSGGSNPNQIGYGVAVNSIDKLMNGSGFATTDQTLDVAIDGEGFFQVEGANGEKFYTRAGILDIDSAGNLVDASGNFVLGSNARTVINVAAFDSAEPHKYVFTAVDNENATSERVNVITGRPENDPVTIDKSNLPDGVVFPAGDAGAVDANGGVTLEQPGIFLANADGSQLVDANGNPVEVRMGDFKNISISKTGEVVAILTKEVEVQNDAGEWEKKVISSPITLGRIDTAVFDNPKALNQVGNNYFQESLNSGKAKAVVPGLESGGGLQSGYLELSNVDLAKEFSDMITTQRGFQANSRIITVSDEMLQELVNLKR